MSNSLRGRRLTRRTFSIIAPGIVFAGLAATSLSRPDASINVGYQSRTLNTVTAGTLLRELQILERNLENRREQTEKTTVSWLDFDSGAPITANMLAGKVDIGSMGDFPLVLNASRCRTSDRASTSLVALCGGNELGALNGIVSMPNSGLTSPQDLLNRSISLSRSSAGEGLLDRAIAQLAPLEDHSIRYNQAPQIGMRALQSGEVAALSQFSPWPALAVRTLGAELLLDGSWVNKPTFHGIVVRRSFKEDHQGLVETFIDSVLEATRFVRTRPLEAARIVARVTSMPLDVVYLYNGLMGLTTFDLRVPNSIDSSLKEIATLLSGHERNILDSFDDFIDRSYSDSLTLDQEIDFRRLLSASDEFRIADRCKNHEISGNTLCELLPPDESQIVVFCSCACMLKELANNPRLGTTAFVPDFHTGSRWFASHCHWVIEPQGPKEISCRAYASRVSLATDTHPLNVLSLDDAITQLSSSL